MKFFIAIALLVAAASAVPVNPTTGDKDAQILTYESDNIGTGPHSHSFETSNGLFAKESGDLKNVGAENEALQRAGEFSYPGPDGVIYSVKWIANEYGFQASGAHLPVPPQPLA